LLKHSAALHFDEEMEAKSPSFKKLWPRVPESEYFQWLSLPHSHKEYMKPFQMLVCVYPMQDYQPQFKYMSF